MVRVSMTHFLIKNIKIEYDIVDLQKETAVLITENVFMAHHL